MNLRCTLLLGSIIQLITLLSVVEGGSIQIEGPTKYLFNGDYELFSCSAPDSQFSQLEWKYGFIDDHFESVRPTEIAEDSVLITNGSEPLRVRRTFIRIRASINKIHCIGSHRNSAESTTDESLSLELNGFDPIEALKEPNCESSAKIILKRWDQSFKSQYWVSHYVTDNQIEISSRISGLKLTCLADSHIKWFTSENLTGFQYWTTMIHDSADKSCYIANLVLSPLSQSAGQKFICGHDKSGHFININAVNTRESYVFDFNKTEECIEHLGSTIFGSQSLTWATTGTSLLSVGMMVGIVFLKKQLDKQKEINSQSQTPPPSSTSPVEATA